MSFFFSFHVGLGVSLGGIIPYRGFQFGALDTNGGLYLYKDDTGILGFISSMLLRRPPSLPCADISYPTMALRDVVTNSPTYKRAFPNSATSTIAQSSQRDVAEVG